MKTDGIKSLIPYYGKRSVRKQIDRVFSRQVLGSIILGKFIGDYIAILTTRYLGTDLGYGLGIVMAFIIFIYWEQIEAAASDKAETAKEKASDAGEKVKEKADEKRNKDD